MQNETDNISNYGISDERDCKRLEVEHLKFKKIVDPGFHDDAYLHEVAVMKRAAEHWTLNASFQAAYREDPAGTLSRYGLDADPAATDLLLTKRSSLSDQPDPAVLEALPLPYLRYCAFLQEKIRMRKLLQREKCEPDNGAFAAWRRRQKIRCYMEIGPAAEGMVHAPIMFELSSGCSVGCPFCGLASERLKSVFRYTPENAELWRMLLQRSHALLGDAAGCGTCYYACEPMDNPDYERFLEDYLREFGTVPQTTTAVATRNIERTRQLLRWGRAAFPHIDRFSVLSAEIRDEIFRSFTPEELILVELLPQFSEAPANNFVDAGRNRDSVEEKREGTIACISGFIVNLAEKTVRLSTPCLSDDLHPTGEILSERVPFTDAEEFDRILRSMIGRYMPEKPDLSKRFRLRSGIRLTCSDGVAKVTGQYMEFPIKIPGISGEAIAGLDRPLTGDGGSVGYDMVAEMCEQYGIVSAYAVFAFVQLWQMGVIE